MTTLRFIAGAWWAVAAALLLPLTYFKGLPGAPHTPGLVVYLAAAGAVGGIIGSLACWPFLPCRTRIGALAAGWEAAGIATGVGAVLAAVLAEPIHAQLRPTNELLFLDGALAVVVGGPIGALIGASAGLVSFLPFLIVRESQCEREMRASAPAAVGQAATNLEGQ